MPTRLSDPGDERSLIHALKDCKGLVPTIDLRDFDLASWSPDESYKTQVIAYDTDLLRKTSSGRTFFDAEAYIDPIEMAGLQNGHRSYTIRGAIQEAIDNAVFHGNKQDPDKEVRLHHRFENKDLEVVVEDQGGVLATPFVTYLLKLGYRQEKGENLMSKSTPFYEYAKLDKPTQRRGEGTIIIHDHSSRARYMRSQDGGLAVELLFEH